MKAFLFLLPLAASTTANPCDAACDPLCDPKNKPKAQVAVVACDPVATPVVIGGGTCAPTRAVVTRKGSQNSVASAGGVSIASTCSSTPVGGVSLTPSCASTQSGTVALAPVHAKVHGQGVAVVAPQCAPKASAGCSATVSGQGVATTHGSLSVAGGVGAIAGSSSPVTLRVEGQGGLTNLVDRVRVARAQGHGDAGGHGHGHEHADHHDDADEMDHESDVDEMIEIDMEGVREQIEEALADAREATREALENAREAQTEAMQTAREAEREAHERAREAQQDAMERGREAQRHARERTLEARQSAQEAARDAAQRLREAQAGHFGNQAMEEETRRAVEQAQQALAEVDWSAFNENAQVFDARDLFAANLNGAFANGDKGLEERVRALERLAREQGHDTGDGSLEDRVAALERALQAKAGKKSMELGELFKNDKNWKLRTEKDLATLGQAYKLGKDGKLSKIPSGKLPAEVLRGRRVAPPAPPAEPAPPAAPFRRLAPGTSYRFSTPDGTPAPSPMSGEERRRIEDAMQSLRAEADALRTELQRMREQIESMPRGGAR